MPKQIVIFVLWFLSAGVCADVSKGSIAKCEQNRDDLSQTVHLSIQPAEDILKAFQTFNQILKDNTVQVTVTEIDTLGDKSARIDELLTFDDETGTFKAELSRYVPSLSDSHPVYIQVACSAPEKRVLIQQSNTFKNGQTILQPPWIRVFKNGVAFDYRSETPFYGTLLPNISKLSEIVPHLNWFSNDNLDSVALIGQGKIGRYGLFEVELDLDGTNERRLKRYSRTINEGERVTPYRDMGVSLEPNAHPRMIVWERTDWSNLVYDLATSPPRIQTADRTTTIRRKNGAEEIYKAHCRFAYLAKQNLAFERITWSLPELVIPEGSPVETVPRDNRRFEFLKNNVFLIVDEDAQAAIAQVEFKETSEPMFFMTIFVVLIVMFGAYFFFAIVSRFRFRRDSES